VEARVTLLNGKVVSWIRNGMSLVDLTVEGLDQLHQELSARGAPVLSAPEDQPWGMREFSIRTPDGHRIRFGESISAR